MKKTMETVKKQQEKQVKKTPKIYNYHLFKVFKEMLDNGDAVAAITYMNMTITKSETKQHWLEQDGVKESLKNAMAGIIANMQKAGNDDWRMWDKLVERMLYHVPKEHNIDLTSDKEPIQILPFIMTKDATNSKTTRSSK